MPNWIILGTEPNPKYQQMKLGLGCSNCNPWRDLCWVCFEIAWESPSFPFEMVEFHQHHGLPAGYRVMAVTHPSRKTNKHPNHATSLEGCDLQDFNRKNVQGSNWDDLPKYLRLFQHTPFSHTTSANQHFLVQNSFHFWGVCGFLGYALRVYVRVLLKRYENSLPNTKTGHSTRVSFGHLLWGSQKKRNLQEKRGKTWDPPNCEVRQKKIIGLDSKMSSLVSWSVSAGGVFLQKKCQKHPPTPDAQSCKRKRWHKASGLSQSAFTRFLADWPSRCLGSMKKLGPVGSTGFPTWKAYLSNQFFV